MNVIWGIDLNKDVVLTLRGQHSNKARLKKQKLLFLRLNRTYKSFLITLIRISRP